MTEKEYDSLLHQFSNDAIWYRAATTDALRHEKVELIAARLVCRIAQKADICPEAITELQCAISYACREVVVGDQAGPAKWRREAVRPAILDAAHIWAPRKTDISKTDPWRINRLRDRNGRKSRFFEVPICLQSQIMAQVESTLRSIDYRPLNDQHYTWYRALHLNVNRMII